MRNIFRALAAESMRRVFSLTSNADEALRDQIIQRAYLAHNSLVWPQREFKKSRHSRQKMRGREHRRAPHRSRAERGEKCAMQRIVRCTCTRAWDGYVSRVPASPPGAKESHIHEIYSGIALLEHLRTMTMHPDALLPARRAIRVMHRNAPSDDCPPLPLLPFSLSLAISSRIVTQKEGRGGSHCAKWLISLRILIDKNHVFVTRLRFREYLWFKLDTWKIYAHENEYYDPSEKIASAVIIFLFI